jgi:hypothetical protein
VNLRVKIAKSLVEKNSVFNAVIYVVSFHAILRFYCIFVRFYGVTICVLLGQKYTIFRKYKGFGAFFRQLSILPSLCLENPDYYSVIRNNMNSFATIGSKTDRFTTNGIIDSFRSSINKNTAH